MAKKDKYDVTACLRNPLIPDTVLLILETKRPREKDAGHRIR